MTPKYRHTPRQEKLKCTFAFLFGFLVCHFLGSAVVLADEVVLATGERFTSSKVWEEGGKIRFNMHGLVVSVNPSDVITIIRSDGTHQPFHAATPQNKPAPADAETLQDPPAPPHVLNPQRQEPIAPEPSTSKPAPQPPAPPAAPMADNPNTLEHRRQDIGLRGVAWSIAPTDINGLVKIKKEPTYGGIDQYWRPDEPLQLGPALLDGKVYGFWRDRLYSIMMWAEGRIGYERLRKVVFDHYGQGRKNSKGLERYVWLDPTTDRMLEFDTALNTGFFWIRSRELDARIKNLYPDE